MGQSIWYNDRYDYCYVPIHKNASSWAKEMFAQEFQFEEHHMSFDEVQNLDKKYIVFVRDPYERWISGIAQWYIQKAHTKYPQIVNEKYKIDPIIFELMTEAVGIDAHTHKQINYISPIKIENGIFFNVSDKNFHKNFEHFLATSLRTNFRLTRHKKNVTNIMTLKGSITRQLKSMLTPEYKTKITTYYQQDLDFIKNCKFYNYTESSL
jgi:hypothetical protein